MEDFINSIWFSIIILIATLWALPWKGVALWKAAQNKHLAWFIVIFLFNTLAILEILYIFIFSKRSSKNSKKYNNK